MTLILAIGIASFLFLPPLYFLLLMADARKLEKRLLRRRAVCGQDGLADKTPPVRHGCSPWMEEPGGLAAPGPDQLSMGPS